MNGADPASAGLTSLALTVDKHIREMAGRLLEAHHSTVKAWAQRCHFAGRAAMETMLRPFDLGTTQWYILHRLVHEGPTMQRDVWVCSKPSARH